MTEGLRLLTVHAHPDDESSKGSATVAKYADDGAYAVLVCCTGGEEGDIINKAMDRPDVRDELPAVRRRELEKACEVIGYHTLHWLGYRDSGMPDSEANAHPDCFANAPLDEAIERLVRLIRLERPHVIVTYSDDQQGYQHPDHLRVHDISVPAFALAGDADAFPDAGAPWQPSKLYYSTWSRARIEALHAKYLELGLESPYDDKWFESYAALSKYKREEAQRMLDEHGLVRHGDDWVPEVDLPYLRMGWVKQGERWMSQRKIDAEAREKELRDVAFCRGDALRYVIDGQGTGHRSRNRE